MKPALHILSITLPLLLAACGPQGDNAIARIALDDAAQAQQGPTLSPSPDVTDAKWQANSAQDSVTFGKPSTQPLFTLACKDGQVTLTRHAPADKGAKALFALIGNGVVSRIKVDEKGDEWAGALPADDPQLAVFAKPGSVEATLPGAGTLKLSGSPLPRDLLARCAPTTPPAT